MNSSLRTPLFLIGEGDDPTEAAEVAYGHRHNRASWLGGRVGRYAAAGLDRVMIRPDSMGGEALESLAKDAGNAGIAPANLSS